MAEKWLDLFEIWAQKISWPGMFWAKLGQKDPNIAQTILTFCMSVFYFILHLQFPSYSTI